jgi:hypothetical protein
MKRFNAIFVPRVSTIIIRNQFLVMLIADSFIYLLTIVNYFSNILLHYDNNTVAIFLDQHAHKFQLSFFTFSS